MATSLSFMRRCWPAAPCGASLIRELVTATPLLARRFGAMLYDLLILVALWMLTAAVALAAVHGRVDVAHPPLPWRLSLQAALLVVTAAYFVLSWCRGGQTIGMRAWRLRLHRVDGGKLGAGRALARFILATLSLALAGAGFWWAWFDAEHRTAHDRLAGTVMLRIAP
jgi:uncharacterized RDD family membrane protein YckC